MPALRAASPKCVPTSSGNSSRAMGQIVVLPAFWAAVAAACGAVGVAVKSWFEYLAKVAETEGRTKVVMILCATVMIGLLLLKAGLAEARTFMLKFELT